MYKCKKCSFEANTGLEVARHMRAEHPSGRQYTTRKAKAPQPEPIVDDETKLLFDAFALFEASPTDLNGCLRVLEYIRSRYQASLDAYADPETDANEAADGDE